MPPLPRSLRFAVTNPATGLHICTIDAADSDDVERTVVDAHAAFESGVWSRAPTLHRSKVLTRLARALEERVSAFAELETLQTGRVIREMRVQLSRLPEWLDYYAALLRTHQSFVAPTQGNLLNYVQRVPLGVVVQITATMSTRQVSLGSAPTPVPSGVLSVLPGPGATTGKDLVSHPLVRKVDITVTNMVSNIPEYIVGGNLAAFTAELGGKVRQRIGGQWSSFCFFVASGQTCVSGTRLLVQSGIYDGFVSQFLEKVKSITKRMGDPMNPKSTMGSKRGSGTVLTGGEPLKDRATFDRFDFSRDSLWKEEVFGPVVVLKKFETEKEGVELANHSQYGLGAGIWTQNLSRAHQVAAQLQSGLVWVNTHHRNDPSSPWGGMKKAFEAYSQSKSTIVNTAPVEETLEHDDWFGDDAEDKRYG
ncbi:Aldehyde/histidinol dehydrogenase [Multifurca ochricompacta]|uniref:Aldehyde/histidinol dehydrogenase n=1 Tax=Multifurca ochricompacta TaxID=376703 RepID=A0AAD4QSG3_9AGAM|nr:Aldehyde/histidinol dehydrogenase [Multifurca ochricompacta]